MPPLIAAALTALTAGAIAGTAATVGGYVIFTAAVIGLSLLFTPDVPKPETARQVKRQSIPPRVGVLGRGRVAGAYMLYAVDFDEGTSIDVLALAHGKMTESERFYLNDDVVVPDPVTRIVAELDDGRYAPPNVRILTRLGANPETAYAEVVAVFGADDIWTNDHRGDAIASAALFCDNVKLENHSKVYPLGTPVLSVALKGLAVFDPRDVAQEWDDPETWVWSDNAILLGVHYARLPVADGGLGYDFAESFLPVLDEIEEQADICDELIPLKEGGTQPRYRAGGTWEFDNAPGDVLNAIIGACDGFMAERGDGAFTIRAGKFDPLDADITFTDRHIINLKVRRFREDEQDVTGVIIKYNSIDHEYATVDAPVWPRDVHVVENDNRIRSTEIIWCQDPFQAQRLAKRIMVYESAVITGTMTTTMFGITALDRRWARIQTSDDPDLADTVIKIDRLEIDLMNGTVEIDFRVIDPIELDAWNPATEEGKPQPVVANPIGDTPPQPSNVNVEAQEFDLGSGAIGIRLEVSFDDPDDANLDYVVRWRRKDIDPGTGGDQPGPWKQELHEEEVTPSGGRIAILSDVVPGNTDLEVQVASRTSGNRMSTWAPIEDVDTGIVAPLPPINFSATFNDPNVGLTAKAPSSAFVTGLRFWRGLTGSLFANATDISGLIAASANQVINYTDTAPGAAEWDYWVTAEGSNGVLSTEVGPDTVLIGEPETAAYIAAMTVLPDAARRNLIDAIVAELIADGIWPKLRALYLLAAHTSQAALLNVIDPSGTSATAVNSPTFTVDEGFDFDGLTQYIDSGLTFASPYLQNDACAFAWSLDNLAIGSAAILGAGNGILQLNPRNAASNIVTAINDGSPQATANSDSTGLFTVSRQSSSAYDVYINASSVANKVVASTALPANNFYLSRVGATFGNTRRIAFGGFGGGLSAGEVANLHSRLNTYMSGL